MRFEVSDFPGRFAGDYFFADLCCGWIRVLDAGGPTPQVTEFASAINGPVDLDVGPDGALYYLARGAGRVGRITYNGPLAPSVTTQPADQSVKEGEPVTFTVAAAGDEPAYQWQRLSAGAAEFVDVRGATAATYTLRTAALADSGARAAPGPESSRRRSYSGTAPASGAATGWPRRYPRARRGTGGSRSRTVTRREIPRSKSRTSISATSPARPATRWPRRGTTAPHPAPGRRRRATIPLRKGSR